MSEPSEAQKIVEKSSKLKEVLEEIYNVRLESKEIKGEVRAFMSMGYASYLVPQDLSDLFDVYPDLTIISDTASSVASINFKDTDIIITYEDINNNDVVLIAEKEVHCGFFASPKYLSAKGYPVDIDDLIENHRLITKYDSLLKRIVGEERFKRAKICFKSNNSLSLVNAIGNNAGVGIMPLSFALQGLVCLDNIVCDALVYYRIYANRHTKDIPRVRTMINFYKAIICKLENPVPVPSLKDEMLPSIRKIVF